MVFDLSQFFKPVTRLDLSSGPVFLYGLSEPDIKSLCRLPKSALSRQKLLASITCLASRQDYDKVAQPDPPRLSQIEVEALAESDLSQIAQAMLDPICFNRLWSVSPEALSHRPVDVTTDTYEDRIGRIVDWLVAERVKYEKKLREKYSVLDRSSYGALHDWIKHAQQLQDPMRAQIEAMRSALGNIDTSTLAETKRMLDAEDELKKFMGPIEALHSSLGSVKARDFSDSPPPYIDHLADMHNTIRDERRKELDYAQTMADAAVTSTRVMEKVSDDLLGFMERFTSAAGASEVAQRKSMNVAIWTFAGAVIVALLGFAVTAMSFWQDKVNNRNNDAWQDRIETLMKQREAREVEVEVLQRQNQVLTSRIEALETKTGGKGAAKTGTAQ